MNKTIGWTIQRRDSDILERDDLANGIVGVRDARANFSRVIDVARTDRSRLLITDNGKPAAAVVPIPQWRILDYLDKLGVSDKVTELAYENLKFDEFILELERMRDAKGGPHGGTTAPKARKSKG